MSKHFVVIKHSIQGQTSNLELIAFSMNYKLLQCDQSFTMAKFSKPLPWLFKISLFVTTNAYPLVKQIPWCYQLPSYKCKQSNITPI